jgi:hypothetical protein
MTIVNGYKGFVGYSIRELNMNETISICVDNKSLNSLSSIPHTQNKFNFTGDFLLRSYTSGCYYYDVDTGKWSPNGMDIYEDTTLEHTHCVSTHLTSFAGGLFLSPSTINFKYLFANASVSQNPTIYLTIIIFVFMYIFFMIWSRIMDKRDQTKIGLYPLKDNYQNDTYFYKLIIFTGNQNESETSSKVKYFFRFYYREFS